MRDPPTEPGGDARPPNGYVFLPLPDRDASAVAIDAAGNTWGGARIDGSTQPARFDAATGERTVLPGGPGTWVVAVDGGGGYVLDVNDGAVVFRNGALHEVAPLAGGLTVPAAMNPSGWVVGYTFMPDGKPRAFAWDGAATRDLGGSASVAMGIDAAGRIVGSSDGRAVIFEGGAPRDLGVAGPGSIAYDISDTGVVVGTCDRDFKFGRALVLDLATGVALRLDPLADDYDAALTAVNPSGTVAVGVAMRSGGAGRALVYRDGRLQDLGTLVHLPQGLRLDRATDVNDAGRITVLARDAVGTPVSGVLVPR